MKTQIFSRPDPYMSVCGNLHFRIRQDTIPGAPGFMQGIKALFVSDVHVIARTRAKDLESFAARINDLQPDILLLGGDFADDAENAGRLLSAMSGVKAPMGTFAAPGNNDREAWQDLRILEDKMADAGMKLLVNESVRLDVGDGRLYVAGVDEHLWGNPDARGLYPEKREEGCYRILISHFPCIPAVMPDLMLSGHTHGGQFNAFGITPYTIGFERRSPEFCRPVGISGLLPMGDGYMFVSKGIGASRIQMRIGVHPEISLLSFGK